ncbi:MAG: T9SS type A sorting domain-containing protein [Ignavibacteria bacterium]|jgi:photosystem II stability/assembly factor-like uncharacterized protein
MKKILIFCSIVLCLQIQYSAAQWVQVGPSNNITFYSLAIKDMVIFAGARFNGVFTSTNNGQNWTQTPMNNQIVYAIAAGSNYVFAGTADAGNGIYITSNYGVNWTGYSVNNQLVNCIGISNSNVFVGTPGGVSRSTNNGQTWVQTSMNIGNVASLLIKDSLIFAGTNAFGVYRSTNYGQNWIQDGLNYLFVSSLAYNGNNIYAGMCGGGIALYLSTNNGVDWNPLGSFDQCVHAIVFFSNNMIIGTQSPGVFISTDNGQNWTQKNEGMGSINILNLLIANEYIFAGSEMNGLWRRPISELIGIKPISFEVPSEYKLSQNYPNPFNPSSTIKFDIPKFSNVKIVIYSTTGQEVFTLVNSRLEPGSYSVEWNASNNPSGVYFYKISATGGAGEFTDVKKMVLLK